LADTSERSSGKGVREVPIVYKRFVVIGTCGYWFYPTTYGYI